MSSIVRDAATVELTGSEPWPDNVRLFQPYEAGQILLTEYANCLSVKALLNFCKLPFSIELRSNAQFISPSGEVPFLQVGSMLVSEFDPIVSFIHAKGHNLSNSLTDEQQAELKAYSALIENQLLPAEMYLSWCDEENIVSQVTKQRYGSRYTWPLTVILPWRKQRQVKQHLKAVGWAHKSMEEVCQQVSTCCQALSQKLGDKSFLFGDRPTEVDALVFGHLFTIITTELPVMDFAEIIESYQNLVDYCTRIDEQYFLDPAISPS